MTVETKQDVSGNGQVPPDAAASSSPYGSLRGHTVDEILSRPYEEVRWVAPGTLAYGSVTSLGGYVGAGKTPLAVRMARSIRNGTPFLGTPVRCLPESVRVAYLTEEPRWSFDQALRDAGVRPDKDFVVFYWDENATADYGQVIRDASDWTEGGVLFVDTPFFWSRISDLGAENDPGKMNLVYRPLVEAAGRGIAVWVNAHTVKTFDKVPEDDVDISGIRGSGSVVANSSVILLYKKLAGDPTADTRFLRNGRTRLGYGGIPRDRYVSLRDGDLVVTSSVSVAMDKTEHLVKRLLDMIADAGGSMTNAELKLKWGADWHTLEEAKTFAVDTGRLVRSGAGKKGNPYTYSVLSPSKTTP